MDSRVSRLIGDISQRAVDAGISVNLVNKKSVRYGREKGTHCGFFSEMNGGTLTVACRKSLDQWLPVLIHESCHMDQFLFDKKIWESTRLKNGKLAGDDATDVLFSWIEGGWSYGYDPSALARSTMKVELDCEIRSVSRILSYGLSDILPVEEYIQKANAYLYLYVYAGVARKWQKPGHEVYNVPDIWTKAPKEFHRNYRKVPAALLKAFQEHI